MYVSVQAVSKWENDQTRPDVEKIGQLASILGTSVNSLIGGEEERAETEWKETTDFSKRLLLIDVLEKNKDTHVTVRIPADLLLNAHENGDVEEQIPDLVFEMIRNGVVGPIVEINDENDEVRIEIVEYDG